MKRAIAAYCAIIAFLTAFDARGQNLRGNVEASTNAPNFLSMPYEEASAAVISEEHLILGIRAKKISPMYVGSVFDQLRSGKMEIDNQVLVIYFLGALKTTNEEVIAFLINHVDLKATRFDDGRIRGWGTYPAQGALIKIGRPATNLILSRLTDNASDLQRRLLCEVLLAVEGSEGTLNQLKQRQVAAQANLDLALKEAEKPRPWVHKGPLELNQ